MQNPTNIKEYGNWIWEMIQKVFAFFMKPLGGIMMVLVTVIGAAIYGDYKSQTGYDQGMKNQKVADSIYIKQLSEVNKELRFDKKELQSKIDTIKNIDCIEENKKAFEYVENMKSYFEKENQSRNQRLKSVSHENRAIRNENKTLEKLIPKTQKQ
ncbi:hypothetical protein SAMN05421866_3477 [Chryseobacterium oranimense]|uniref:Uncharacterized protein n=1 Tax=Chryseobacterium oranimense TaxID=421058 RepID=A0A1M5V0F0_9FLAO|nr:hypothetical protein [Chryseobacterium oranimense]SHH68640.1 hypothetical protein SAMN05421866_3477 [Chryseobacterium oranimense]